LSAPMDIQQQAMDDDDEYVPSSSVSPAHPVYPNPESIERAAEIITSSAKPVVIVGRGAMWSGAGAAVLKLSERIGALIATTLMAKNWLAAADYHAGISGFYCTRTGLEMFREAEFVVDVGASLNRY